MKGNISVIDGSNMSRELRDKAEVMMKELNELLKPLQEEIKVLRTSNSTSYSNDVTGK